MKKTVKLLVCILCMLCSGCGEAQKTTDPTLTPNTTQAVFSPLGSEEISGDATVIEEQPIKENAAELAQYNAMNRKLDSTMEADSIFCIDDKTGAVYFVNINKDWYIYNFCNGKTELVVAMPAKELYVQDGILYFMLDSHDVYDLGERMDGDIYQYNPQDGEVALVYAIGEEDAIEHKMNVTENGIYFSVTTLQEVESQGEIYLSTRNYSYYLAFGASEAVKDTTNGTSIGWRDYYINFFVLSEEDYTDGAPLRLFSKINGTSDYIDLNIGRPGACCLLGDTLYYEHKNGVCSLNLESFEKQEYSFVEAKKQAFEELNIEWDDSRIFFDSYTLTDNGKYLWTEDSIRVYRMNLETGEISYFRMCDNVCNIDELYTDGEQLYATYSVGDNGVPVFVRIKTEEVVKNILDQDAFAVEYLTN